MLSLAWNKEGSSLLSAGDYIQLWAAPDVHQTVEFFEREQLTKVRGSVGLAVADSVWRWRRGVLGLCAAVMMMMMIITVILGIGII